MPVKTKVEDLAKEDIRSFLKTVKKTHFYKRIQFIHYKKEGIPNEKIAALLHVCLKTLTNWMNLFSEKGMDGDVYKRQDIKGSTVIDRSGKGNDGTITGAVPVKGKVGQGLSFDGTGDYVSIVDSGTGSDLDFENGDSITITGWVNPREISGGRVILTKDTLGDCGYTTNYYFCLLYTSRCV